MDESVAKLAVGQKDFPKTIASQFQRILVAVPVVEVAHQREVMCCRSPFAVPPAVTAFVIVEAQELMRRSEGLEATITANDTPQPFFIAVVAFVNGFADGFEPRVVCYERERPFLSV